MSSVDEEKQPKLPVIVIDTHPNESSNIHPELMSLSLGKSNLNTATRKINAKNVDLNENTDGFITQINVEDAGGVKPVSKQNNSYNIQTLDPQLLIPNENKKPTHHQTNFMRLHSSSTNNNNNNNNSIEQSQSTIRKEPSLIELNLTLNSTSQEVPPPPPPTSNHHFLTRLNSKVDFNDTTLSDEYYDDLNYSNAKETPQTTSSAKKPQHNFRHHPHHQLNKSKTDLNSINELSTSEGKGGGGTTTGGGSIFSFFPNIPGRSMISNVASGKKHENKTKFPVHKSFFDRNIYVQYLTGKLEKPKEDINHTASLIRIHQQQNLLPKSLTRLERRHQSKSFNVASSYSRATSNKMRLTGASSDTSFIQNAQATSSFTTMDEKQVFVDFKGVKSPPPSQLGRHMSKSTPKPPKTLPNNNRSRNVNPRFRNYDKVFRKDNAFLGRKGFISHSFANNKEAKVPPTQPTSYSTMSHVKPFKKIIDLNQLNNDSKLASHYLAYQSASHLSELKLHDVWPSSKMYKVTIKSNPWVDKYKSISYAHEVNDSFRHFKPSNRLPTIKTQVY